MSVAKRSNPVEGHTGSGTSVATSAFATNPVTGDTIIVIQSTGGAVTHQAPTDPAGNVYTQIGTTQDSGGTFHVNLSVWRKENATGFSGAVTGHCGTASPLTTIAWCLSGANTPTSYNADTAGATNTASANPASGTSSPAPAAASFFIAACCTESGSTATAGSGWEFVSGSTQTDNASFQDLYTEELTTPNTSSSAQNGQFTLASTAWCARVASVAPVAGPTITAQPQHNSVLAGQTAVFTVSATGSGSLNYQWKRNGSNVGPNAASYGRIAAVPDDGASMSCDVTDDNGTTSSAAATLGVRTQPTRLPPQLRMR